MAMSTVNAEYMFMPQATLQDAPASLARRGVSRPDPDQRRTPRIQIAYPAQVTVVGSTGRILHGVIQNISEGGTQLRLDEPLPPSTLVRIEYEDNLLLGEVVYCQDEESGWLAGVRIEHGLFGLSTLAVAMQGF
jgi:hypothetical protein